MNTDKIVTLEFEHEKAIRIVPIGDIHDGHKDHDEETFDAYLADIIKNKDMYVFLMGDLIECSNRHSVGLYDQVKTVDEQIESVIKKLEPIAKEGRILGMVEGNHERRAKKHAGIDISNQIAKRLNIPYYGIGVVLHIKVRPPDNKRSQVYYVYFTHGDSRARTAGGKINACMRLRDVVNVDCYCMGHVHSLEHHTESVYEPDRWNLRLKRKHFVLTGSYLKYWDSYAQSKGYSPSGSSGSPKIKLHSTFHRISVSL